METNSYHDTTRATYEELKENEIKARTQDQFALLVMKEIKKMSPSRVWGIMVAEGYVNSRTPITSIRRSMSNLKNEGLIRKTDEKVIGPYGRPEFIYELAE